MSTFFQGQMDYVFFACGLAFVGLGVVSFILSREDGQRLPWIWLAWFGAAQGLYQWLNLLALARPDWLWLAFCGWALMAASFLFLVEFGWHSLMRQRGHGPGRWVLGVLVLGAGLGALAGWNGLNASTSYGLGLAGSLGAGWALVAEGRQADSRCRPWLLAGGAGFLLYGLATGVIVPQAAFFPAATINQETFRNLTGLPIQLVQGLLTGGIAFMTLGYFLGLRPTENGQVHRLRTRYLYVVGAALAVILVFGWFLTQFLGNLAWQQVQRDSLAHNRLAIQRLTFEERQAEEAVRTMSGSPWIGPALRSRSPETLARANQVLDRYQQRFGASVVYLLDQSGTTIASSNRDAPDSFVGHLYDFRPYFQEALAGKIGRYLALGVTSKKRGFYISCPVRDSAGKISGVAVFKMSLTRFQQDLKEFDPAFLIDPQGIVLVASRPNLDYHSLWPVAPRDPASFKNRYGTDRITPIFSHYLHEAARVKFAGGHYVVMRQNISNLIASGWTLVNLEPFNLVIHYRIMGIVAAFFTLVLIMVFAGNNLTVREGANRILASEARFRAIFAAAPEAVFVFDPGTGRILDANPFMAQWLGYEAEELLNLKIDQVFEPEPPVTQEPTAEEGRGVQSGIPPRRCRRRDGSLVDVELTDAQILHGDHIRKLVFVRDITARRQAEAELAWEARANASFADLSRALLASLPLDEITSLVSLHAKNLTDSPQAFCGYINPQTGALQVPSLDREACGVEEKKITFHRFGGLWGWVLEHGQPLLTNNPAADPRSGGTPPGHFPIQRFVSVPAIIEGKLVGQIGLANAPRDYTARDQEVCERLARLLALAIHRQRMEATLRESEGSLKTILENVQTGMLIIDPESHVIVDTNAVAVKLLGVPKENIVGSPCHKFVCPPEEGGCPVTDLKETVNEAERVIILPDESRRWVLQTVVPVTLNGKARLLESFVDITERRQWEEAIQTANDKLQVLVSQVEARNSAMTMANEMTDLLQSCQDLNEAYEAISHFMPRFFPDDAGALYMLSNSRNFFEAVAVWGQDPPPRPVFAPEECWSVRRGRLHRVDDSQNALVCRHLDQADPHCYLCVPLIAQGETLGVFHIRLKPPGEEEETAPMVDKERLALTVAEDMALALANLRLQETLRSQAIRDPLTGLFNRRYMEETMERELNRVKRQEAPLGVVMMDLDHFKQYNDTFGHEAGDELLRALGSLIRSQVREEDIACRYGGEEFLLIMPGASLVVTLERAEMLRQAVKEMHRHYQGLKPTALSLGVAVYPDHGETGLEIIRAADAALYRAKQAGRDQVLAITDEGETRAAKAPLPSPYLVETG
jgi:diguanylate cyclase (GGDEF)-like protein/PAS domain S-box-containing protein